MLDEAVTPEKTGEPVGGCSDRFFQGAGGSGAQRGASDVRARALFHAEVTGPLNYSCGLMSFKGVWGLPYLRASLYCGGFAYRDIFRA